MKNIKPFHRQIHLDFHTSEHCEDVGELFREEDFVAALRAGHVNAVNVFALCHHGWCYYPTEAGRAHPHLGTDLLGRMLSACHEAGIQAVVYVSVGWNERLFREHPEWACRDVEGDFLGPRVVHPSAPRPFYGWHRMCVNTPYLDGAVLPIVREIAEEYGPAGFWFDITGPVPCACPHCRAGAADTGLDPERPEDLEHYGLRVFKQYLHKTSQAVWENLPEASIYHNSSNDPLKEDEELLSCYSHLEIESLPTGFWGYEFFPVAARYWKPRLSEHQVVGMTGKFHTSWGEFGGFKSPVALRYEAARIVAHACLPCVGDQLHPSGAMDPETYRLIGEAYAEVERREPWLVGAHSVADVAVLSPTLVGSHESSEKARDSEFGACQALMEMHVPHVVVDGAAPLEDYRLLVLPDSVRVEDELAHRLSAFQEQGGSLLLSGTSGVDPGGNRFAVDAGAEYLGPSACDVEYVRPCAEILQGLVDSPVLVYQPGARVRTTDGSVLAETHEPLFNRTYGRFCSHRNSPPRMEPSGPAVVRKGEVIHVSQRIFRAYRESGALLTRRLVENCLNSVHPDRLVEVDLPSAGEVCVTEQSEPNRLMVHLLYATPLKRGSVRVVEDVVDLFDMEIGLRSERIPTKVYVAPDEQPLEFLREGDRTMCRLPRLSLSAIVAFEFGKQ